MIKRLYETIKKYVPGIGPDSDLDKAIEDMNKKYGKNTEKILRLEERITFLNERKTRIEESRLNELDSLSLERDGYYIVRRRIAREYVGKCEILKIKIDLKLENLYIELGELNSEQFGFDQARTHLNPMP